MLAQIWDRFHVIECKSLFFEFQAIGFLVALKMQNVHLKFVQLKVLDAFVYALTCKKLILIASNFNDFPSITQRIALKGLQRVKEFS